MNTAKDLKKMSEEFSIDRVVAAMNENILSVRELLDLEQHPEEKDKKLDLFENVALLLKDISKKLEGLPKKVLNFFGMVEDSNKEDLDDGSSFGDWFNSAKENMTEKSKKLIETAHNFLGSTAFRGPEVSGGNLACAQVVSRALHQAGYLDSEFLGIIKTKEALLQKGWTLHSGPGKPGDVIIWKRTEQKTDDGQVELGHGHIGIVVEPGRVVSNSSGAKTPRLHGTGENTKDGYWYKRGIETFLSPPTNV